MDLEDKYTAKDWEDEELGGIPAPSSVILKVMLPEHQMEKYMIESTTGGDCEGGSSE